MFTDSSLAVAALGATPEKLLHDLQVFGGIFEGLCLRDLLIYADANNAKVFHYRDNSNLEVDAIVETRDGAWGAFEIKLGKKQVNEGARALLSLKNKMMKQGAAAPVCLVVLTGTGIAAQREDGVYVVPIGMLKD
jgi:predicted AAA+ superfamily ATPase